ncbi:MAG: ATP-binding protein [Coprobacillaceae bacterium]
MALLPKNEPKEKDVTPKIFYIWGGALSGKTYLARKFPNPVLFNTDGNAKKVDTPSVELKDFETFIQLLQEVESGNHEFKTIIIDLVDDLKTMLELFVCKKHGVETLADVGFGKAFAEVNATWKKTMIRLSHLPYNVIFISHIKEISEGDNTIEVPSLEQKYLNVTMGRCDVVIQCRKAGKTYLQLCRDKRDNYEESDIKDKNVLNILKNVRGVFKVQEQPDGMVKKGEKPMMKKAEVK